MQPISRNPQYYKFNHERMGIAYIVNQKRERPGSEKDGERIKKVLEDYGFEVFPKGDDVSIVEVTEQLKELSARDYSKYNCFLMVIMAHGDGRTFKTAEGIGYDIGDLYPYFYPTQCPTLADKPKLFFIQACRGQSIDPGYVKETKMDIDIVDSPSVSQRIPLTADILTMYASDAGYVAVRPAGGSWFIQTLCEELENAKHNNGIILFDLLINVQRRVATEKYSIENDAGGSTCQMPSIISTLTKHCFLTPRKIQNKILLEK